MERKEKVGAGTERGRRKTDGWGEGGGIDQEQDKESEERFPRDRFASRSKATDSCNQQEDFFGSAVLMERMCRSFCSSSVFPLPNMYIESIAGRRYSKKKLETTFLTSSEVFDYSLFSDSVLFLFSPHI